MIQDHRQLVISSFQETAAEAGVAAAEVGAGATRAAAAAGGAAEGAAGGAAAAGGVRTGIMQEEEDATGEAEAGTGATVTARASRCRRA